MDDEAGSHLGPTFLVEQYWPGVTAEEFRAATDLVRRAAAALDRQGRHVSFLQAALVPEDEAAYCLFEADSSAVVERVYREAGVRFDRVVRAMDLGQVAE